MRLEDDAGTGDGLDSDGLDSDALDTEAGAADRGVGRDDEFDDDDEERAGRGARLSIPLVPVLAVLLVLLLGGVAYLWFTRPSASSVTTGDYVDVLEAARSEVVDLTSFDYQTLDDDIAQARAITVGDLQKESVAQLTDNRKQLTDQQAVVNTQVVGAGVTRANGSDGTVLLVIQSTQRTKGAAQPAIVRYRIQADLTKVDGRWLLSGITGR
jgi:Mce-associated membrane protein